MKIKYTIIFAFLAFTLMSSCKKVKGDGEIVSIERTVLNFTQVHSSIGDKVIINQGDFKLQIKAQQNIADEIETYVENNVLYIKYKKNKTISSHKPVEVFVNLPKIAELKLQGSGSMVVLNRLTSSELSLSIDGSGSMIATELVADELEAKIDGSGDLKISNGSVDQGALNISGSGSMDLFGVAFRECDIDISGSGSAKVNVAEKLDVKISGSGSVYYIGDPVVTQQVSGSGSVQKK